jgi:CzcA family heavy metal efflux pump
MFSWIIENSIKNRYLVTFFAIAVICYGLASSLNLPIDVFPDFAPTQVIIKTEAPGYAPEEVESLITIQLETNLSGIAGLEDMRSLSSTGLSVLTLIFDDTVDIFKARQLVSEKLQLVRSELPQDIDQPLMAPMTTATGDIIKIGLIAKETSLMDVRTLADWTIARKLLSINGVSNIVVHGGDPKQYQVLINPNKLKDYSISLDEFNQAISESNTNATGGFLRDSDKEYLIRGLGRIESIQDLENTVIKTKEGIPVLVKNLAEVKIGSEQKIGEALINGKRGILINVSKQPWANTRTLTDDIEEALENLKSAFPSDLETVTVFRQADFIDLAIHNMLEALILGSILVIIILYFFLQNWRTAFISLTAIPLSILIAIIVLKWQGGTINTMTLGGLAIAIGEVVDDAIIDVENVFRRLKENKLLASPRPVFDVIVKASKEIRASVIYATFIIALVFLPILSLTGLEGKIFSPLAHSFIIAILASLAVALTVTPALCYLLLNKTESFNEKESTLIAWLKEKYTILLEKVMSNPKKVLYSSVVLFLISLLPLFFLGKSFLPEFDESNLIIAVNSVPGTSLDITSRTGEVLTQHLISDKEVIAVGQRAGRAPGSDDYGSSNFSEFDVRLSAGGKARHKIINHVREDFGKIPGIVINVGSYITHKIDHVLSGVNAPIVVKIYGADLEILHKKAKEIETLFKTVKGATEVQVEPIIPIPQIVIDINREQAMRYGLSVSKISRTIETAFKGKRISKVLEGQKSFDLVSWFKPEFRNSLESIKNILIDTPTGQILPISSIAKIHFDTTPNTISRDNSSRRVVVQANVSGRDLGSVIDELRAKVKKEINFDNGYYIEYGGQFEAQERATKQLILYSLLAITGIFLLLIMAFKSIKIALLVLINLPLALIGGIWSIVIFGGVLSVGSLVGFITLFGISTRNGIMLITHLKDVIEEGVAFEKAIKESAIDRLSPVLMTALTAALGVLPIAIMGGAGRELEQPLAIVILGGMFSSTFLTLMLMPALFKLFGRRVFNIK